MKLRSMTATFGCLENASMALKPGLNLLELPNESGKSTWCAFLRAMFYGLESRKGGALSERNRYTPWSGAPMSGTVDLVWQEKAITLRRFGKGSNPFGGFQAVYTGTEEAVPGLTGDNAGEVLLGMTKEVFARTCFIPQGGLGVAASGELERRVATLAAAGEEDVSYSDAEGRLRAWRNARQSNRASGTLPKLRAQLAQVQAQRQRLLDARVRGAEAAAVLKRLEAEGKELEADLARHQKAAQARALADARKRYDDAAMRLAQGEDALAQAREDSKAAKGRIPAPPGPAWRCRVPLLVGLGLGALFVALFLLFNSPLADVPMPQLWPLIPAGLITATIGGWLTQLLARRRREAERAYAGAAAQWEAAQEAEKAAQTEHIAARAAWEAISAQGEPPAAPAVADTPRQSLGQDQLQLKRNQEATALYRGQLSRCQGEEEALGGLEPLDEAQAALMASIEKEEGELAALNLALEALGEANAQLQARFSPALNAKAGALLSRLTGGRYDKLTFTRSFEAMAQCEGGVKSAQLLSQGTADQAYLALRLALCLLALPGEDPAPMVLDDALVTFDDQRLKLALDLLSELAGERQILLFTCQGRERALLAGG